jgi:hypothetical protein
MVFTDDPVVFEFLDLGHAIALAFDGFGDGLEFFFVADFFATVLINIESHGEIDLEWFWGGQGDGRKRLAIDHQ